MLLIQHNWLDLIYLTSRRILLNRSWNGKVLGKRFPIFSKFPNCKSLHFVSGFLAELFRNILLPAVASILAFLFNSYIFLCNSSFCRALFGCLTFFRAPNGKYIPRYKYVRTYIQQMAASPTKTIIGFWSTVSKLETFQVFPLDHVEANGYASENDTVLSLTHYVER